MNIILNGKPHTLTDGATISDLIAEMDLVGKRIAVEINLDIIPRSEHDVYKLQPDDKVEVVHAIGGGQL